MTQAGEGGESTVSQGVTCKGPGAGVAGAPEEAWRGWSPKSKGERGWGQAYGSLGDLLSCLPPGFLTTLSSASSARLRAVLQYSLEAGRGVGTRVWEGGRWQSLFPTVRLPPTEAYS